MDVDYVRYQLFNPILVLPDGKILQRHYNTDGLPGYTIRRSNADGSSDSAYQIVTETVGGRDETPNCGVALPDGRAVVACGAFLRWLRAQGGIEQSREVRDWLPLTPSGGGQIRCMARHVDGTIYLGVRGGSTGSVHRLVRLGPDGTFDSSFTVTADNQIEDVLVQPDGAVVVAGRFTSINGSAHPGLARLGGGAWGYGPSGINLFLDPIDFKITNDIPETYQYEARFDYTPLYPCVLRLALQADGKIILFGSFENGLRSSTTAYLPGETVYLGASAFPQGRSHLARIDRDGRDDNSFAGSVDEGAGAKIVENFVYGEFAGLGVRKLIPHHMDAGLAIQADGKVLVGGEFNNVQWNFRDRADNSSQYGGPHQPVHRPVLARFTNDAFSQSLSFRDQTQVVWTRTGAGPELESAIFEWTPTGGHTQRVEAKRMGTSSNWQLSGIQLGRTGTFRAVGMVHRGGMIEFKQNYDIRVPQLVVEAVDGTPIANGARVTFKGSTQIFRLRNHGDGPLTVQPRLTNLIGRLDFTITPGTFTVPAGGYVDFPVNFYSYDGGVFRVPLDFVTDSGNAVNEMSVTFNAQLIGTTLNTPSFFVPPTVGTVSSTSATVSGYVAHDGGPLNDGAVIEERGVIYAPLSPYNPTFDYTSMDFTLGSVGQGFTKVVLTSGDKHIDGVVPNLTSSTTYVYRLYATNATATGYSAVRTFTTAAAPPANRAPVAIPRSPLNIMEGAVAVPVEWTEIYDLDEDPVRIVVKTPPSHGRVATDPYLTYTPDHYYEGSDSFVVCAVDPHGLQSAPSTIYVSVIGGNDAPTFELPEGEVTGPAGAEWEVRAGVNGNWSSLTSSDDGRILAAAENGGKIYVSTNHGKTWTARGSNRAWSSVAISGETLVAAVDGGRIYTSPDLGVTWTERASERAWRAVASASSGSGGQMAAIASGGQIWTSADYGENWTPRQMPREWSAIAMTDFNGVKLLAAANNGYLYTSTDGGANWSQRAGAQPWRSVAISSDGTKMTAAAAPGRVWTSDDSGVTWTEQAGSPAAHVVVGSQDGTFLVAATQNGRLHTSTDSGVTWTAQEALHSWQALACSTDGRRLVAAVLGGKILCSAAPQEPYLISVPSGTTTMSFPNFAWNITSGSAEETGQAAQFTVTNDNPGLFAVQPTISQAGTLTFTRGTVYGGTATVTVTATDSGGGIATSPPQTFQIRMIDTVAPTITSHAMGSSNLQYWDAAKVGDTIRLTIQGSEPIYPNVTIAGRPADNVVTSNGIVWIATLIVSAGDREGLVEWTLDYKDLAGNSGPRLTGPTPGNYVTIDNQPPTLTMVRMVSENANPAWAKQGDGVYIDFISSEPLRGPRVSFGGMEVDAMPLTSTSHWGAGFRLYQMITGTPKFSISFADRAGNAGISVTDVTEGPLVAIDMIAPVLTQVPSDMLVETTSASGASVTYPAATATDNSGISPTLTYSRVSGAVFPVGSTLVVVTAKDAANNSTTGSFTVTVVNTDTSKPTLAAPITGFMPLTVKTEFGVGATAILPDYRPQAVVTGGVGVVTRTQTPAPGSRHAAGSPVAVSLTARDTAGNLSNTLGFNVVVEPGADWRPQSPLMDTRQFAKVWFANATTGWAVGYYGKICATTDGGLTWRNQNAGTAEHLLGVWGTDPKNVWAVGVKTILKWDGYAWGVQTVPQGLAAIWGSDANNVWAVGGSGVILKWNGTVWVTQTSGTTQTLTAVWGADPNNVWAVGEGGTIRKWNGSVWSVQTSGTSRRLSGVWCSDADNVWAVGEGRTILKWNGSAWAAQNHGTTMEFYGVWGTDANNVWAAGAGVNVGVAKWDGSAWSTQTVAPGRCYTVGGTDANNVWAAGDRGVIAKWNGSAWNTQASALVFGANSMWGTSSNNIWAAGVFGSGGRITRWNGSTWALEFDNSGSGALNGVWGSDENNVWAVGKGGQIRKWNGAAWSMQTSGTGNGLNAVWGTNVNNVWAVGDNGTILKWNGSAWSAHSSGTTKHLYGVWGSDANNVWAVGYDGAVQKWNGSAWTTQTIPYPRTLYGVWGVDAYNVWVVGDSGTIRRWNGSGWEEVTSGTSRVLKAVWGTGVNNVWAVGEYGTIRKWNGSAWGTEISGTIMHCPSVWGSSPSEVVVASFMGDQYLIQTNAPEPAGPAVVAASPTSGAVAGGTSVTITGTNFTGAASVTFGGSIATGMTVVNDTTITVTTPAHAAGAVDVTVNRPDGTGTGGEIFTYELPETTAPETTITSTQPALTNSAAATITFTGSDNVTPAAGLVFEGRMDGAAFATVTSPVTLTGLTDGTHTYEVRAKDAAGNIDATPAHVTWTVDTLPPDVVISSGPSGTVGISNAAFVLSGSEPGTTFAYRIDGGAFVPVASLFNTGPLADGPHTLEVRATDLAGNVRPTLVIHAWTVDTTPPAVPLIVTPGSNVFFARESTITISGTAEAGSVVTLYEGDGTHATTVAGDGTFSFIRATSIDQVYSFMVSATDGAGHKSDLSAPITVIRDSVAPRVPGNMTLEATGPGGATAIFETTDADVAESSFLPVSGTTFPLGTTAVSASVTDRAGNTSTGSFNVTVQDTTKPMVAAYANIGPIDPTSSSGAVVTYPSASATDAVTVSPMITYSKASGTLFPRGTTTVTIFAEDMAGNVGTGFFTVTVRNTTPPELALPTSGQITTTTAMLGATITSTGFAAIIERGVVIAPTGTNDTPRMGGAGVIKVTDLSAFPDRYEVSATGLTPGVSYSFAGFATNSEGTSYSSTGTFTTVNDDASLSALVLSAGTLSPAFASGTTAYACTVPNNAASLTVTPTTTNANATVRVNNGVVSSGSASPALPLNVGLNPIIILVTAQDGTTTRTYTVAVTSQSVTENALEDWAADQGLPPSAAGPLADADGDGVPNLMEFAFGTSPSTSSAAPMQFSGTFAGGVTVSQKGQPVVATEPSPTGTDFRAVFVQRVDKDALGLTYTVKFSADLVTWQTSTVTPTVLGSDGTHQAVSVPYPPFVGGKKARFFTVGVDAAP
ncbi:MAG: HYR domain-containing protein [Prosthecobacter sp.]